MISSSKLSYEEKEELTRILLGTVLYVSPEQIVRLNKGCEIPAFISRVGGCVEVLGTPVDWILEVKDDDTYGCKVFTIKKQGIDIEPMIEKVFATSMDLAALARGEKADVWISESPGASVIGPIPLSWVVDRSESDGNCDRIIIQKPEF